MNRQVRTESVLAVLEESKIHSGGGLDGDLDGNPRPARLYVEASFALAAALLLTIPSVKYLAGSFRRRPVRRNDGAYEDEDGCSSAETLSKFSTRVPRSLVASFAVLGCFTSTHLSIIDSLGTTHDNHLEGNWLYSVAWIVLVFNASCLVACRDSTRAYSLGVWLGLAASTLFLALLDLEYVRAVFDETGALSLTLRAVGLLSSIGLSVSAVSIPRRPHVYRDGRPVERHLTVSAIERVSYSWAGSLLRLAEKKRDLDATDLPALDHHTRSEDQSASWKSHPAQTRLWRAMFRAYRDTLLQQWVLSAVKGVTNYAPHLFLLKLLETIEGGLVNGQWPLEAWFSVLGLVLSVLIDGTIESWLYWLSFGEISVPLRAQLAALIVEKSMKRKNVKGAGPSTTPSQSESDSETTPLLKPNRRAGDQADDEDGADPLQSRQGIINLVGVDTSHIANFSASQFQFVHCAFKIAASLTFQTYLLGLAPVAAGLAVGIILFPVSGRLARVYTRAQERMMKARDEQLRVVDEALQGARQIKFQALEEQWGERILATRGKVLVRVWDTFMADVALFACWISSPIASTAAALTTYAILNQGLTASVAFVGVAVFRSLEASIGQFPILISDFLDASVSTNRIESYLNGPEIKPITEDGSDIAFEGVSIAWPVDEETPDEECFVLRAINLRFPRGELSVISGKTGSGKSLLLSALIGEADLVKGRIFAPNAPTIFERHDHKANRDNWIIPTLKAYVAQTPWIENASLRDNILFGLPLDEERFGQTLDACALRQDLAMFPDGDLTELGTNGINLSGGQKWRVTLARAVYSRAGILVLDDIFSAVDVHVGRHIFEKCLTGELCRGRTRILVTHHVALCQPRTRFLVELGEGTVLHAGFIEELREDGTLELIKAHEESEQGLGGETAVTPHGEEPQDGNGGFPNDALSKLPRRFIEEEGREKGAVKTTVYKAYFRSSGGYSAWAAAVFMWIVFEGCIVARSYWLKIWTGSEEADPEHAGGMVIQAHPHLPGEPHAPQPSLYYYLAIYIAISAITALIAVTCFLYNYHLSIKASTTLFRNITTRVLRAPLRWLDTTPPGRVLNRFTADFDTVDTQLARNMMLTADSALDALGICVAATLGTPTLLVPAAILTLGCARLGARYLCAARPARRLESVAKSPMFDLYGAVLLGLSTVRASGVSQSYLSKMYGHLDAYSAASRTVALLNQWLSLSSLGMGALFTGCAGCLVLLSGNAGPAIAGFTMSFALGFSGATGWAVRCYARTELDMNAAERVVEYTLIETEDSGGVTPPDAWPSKGKVDVQRLVVGYTEDLPPVLKGLSFSVGAGERVGIVGRTGAGKSSLALALFRFLEAREGRIVIDGVDIARVKLHDLRSRLAIIPQDPVLFSGTIRSNLDPFDKYTDAELYDSLRRVHLLPSTPSPDPQPSIFANLSYPITESGTNLSQGQRQLLTLARALTSRPRLLILDEATSAVSPTTDTLVQRSLREGFEGCTMIVVAHRLSTVADFDRIVVLGDGEVVEEGRPPELWGKGGVFRGLCEGSGEREVLKGIILGRG